MRYHEDMEAGGAADLIERLANLLERDRSAAAARHGLTGAQLSALLYLVKANRYSNTPGGVAEYVGSTKGTISQTLLKLERDGWIRRTRDKSDGRVVHLEPAAKARRAAEAFAESFRDASLEDSLRAVLAGLQVRRGGKAFGVCRTCRYFLTEPEGHRCGLTREPLALTQITLICREHAA